MTQVETNVTHNCSVAVDSPISASSQRSNNVNLVANRNSNHFTTSNKTDILTEVATTVRKTMVDAARRKRNVIVSGLWQSSTQTDTELFSDLYESHFGDRPRIVHPGTRRLGKSTEGANQPRRILIHLASDNDAQEILVNAKLLRESQVSYIRESVYINADLSREEAKEAYRKRCLRRQISDRSVTVDREHTVMKGASCENNSAGVNGAANNVVLSVWNSRWTRSHYRPTTSNLIVRPSDVVYEKDKDQMSSQSNVDQPHNTSHHLHTAVGNQECIIGASSYDSCRLELAANSPSSNTCTSTSDTSVAVSETVTRIPLAEVSQSGIKILDA